MRVGHIDMQYIGYEESFNLLTYQLSKVYTMDS